MQAREACGPLPCVLKSCANMFTDTILAISSPPAGTAGVRGIVRVSGPAAWPLARAVTDVSHEAGFGWHGNLRLPLPRGSVDAALMLFQGPRSFSGEDIAELHVANSPALLRFVIEALLAAAGRLNLPARLAEPGEFTARAFFNGKVDLTEAEGIAATINAANETQLRAATSLRQGDLHQWIHAIVDRLANILALLEAGIDFVDEEDVSFIDAEKLEDAIDAIADDLQVRLESSVRIDQLNAPPTVVFIGPPNVGKSSLINALVGHDRSIVSPVPGTTRDVLTAALYTPAGEIRLVDVPGEEPVTDELREKMMAARSAALLDADLILDVRTDDHRIVASLANNASYGAICLSLQNKADLLPPTATAELAMELRPCDPWQIVSAKTGHHIPELRAAIIRLLGDRNILGPYRIVLNHRHREIFQEAKIALRRASQLFVRDPSRIHPELLAAELRHALDLLGQITGTISPDDVLGRIFSSFCIGK